MLEKAEDLDLEKRAEELAEKAERLRRELDQAAGDVAEAEKNAQPAPNSNERLEEAIETLEKIGER